MTTMLGAEAAAGVAAVAKGAFNYNRENYFFDAGLRFARFNTGYSMAMAQVSQYREDISDLTELTVGKADTYHGVGTICFVLNFQLIMAGRLGVHGPAPPGWLMGMYWTNICSALMFLVMFTWMAMHSGARATAGAANMRTRTVRLPIPTPKMLDEARMLGNEFEKQRVVDIFRVPFVAPAAKESVEDPETGKRVPISDRRMPRWYHDEVAELRKDEGGAAPSPNSNPEHFELYRGLQEEWWGYDVYSRIGITFFFSNWLASVSLYSMCHVFTELRHIWPAWTVVACFATAHYGILRLEITPPADSAMPPMEKVVPFVPVLAVAAMTIDYSVLDPHPVWLGLIYGLAWIGYGTYFLWALRMYDLARPRHVKEAPEMPGQPWTPSEWPLPPAFKNCVYFVSAPKYLEPGNTCLLQEMKAAKGEEGQKAPLKKARECQPAMLPWKLFRGACITKISMWILIMFGRGFEQLNGERQLLKQEGRVERWPSHMQPWMAPWTRKGSRNEMCHAGGCDRRLSDADSEVSTTAQQLIATLGPLAQAFDAEKGRKAAPAVPKLVGKKVSWPAAMRPSILASHAEHLIALERSTGKGAYLLATAPAGATEFMLNGVEGDVLGATMDQAGLVLTMSSGAIAECIGLPIDGAWACRKAEAPVLPAGLASAAAARDAAGKLRAAVVFPGDDSVTLLDADGAEWAPVGEVHVPGAKSLGHAPKLSMGASAKELLISTADGAVHQRVVEGKAVSKKVVAAAPAGSTKMWHTACSLGGDRVAHIAHHGAVPELFVSA
jgi:hypothetical protein